MDISKIIAISGKTGLFSIISSTKTGMLVESLTDGTKIPVFATDKISAMSDISLYTTNEDKPLKIVLQTIFKNLKGEKAIDPKSSKQELFAFMDKAFPEWDKDRIYQSDIKKLVLWYNILIEKKLIDEKEESEENKNEEEK